MKKQNLILKNVALSTFTMALSLGTIGCNKKSSNTETISSSFAMTASNKPATVALKPNLINLLLPRANALTPSSLTDSSGLAINLSQSWVVIKEIEFKASETASSEEVSGSEVAFKGPYFVDLLSNAPAALDSQNIPATSFQRIKMKLHKAEGTLPATVPAALNANSIYLAGSIGSGGSAVNFEFLSDDGAEYQIGGPKAVSPHDGGQILVEIKFADIFKQINMSTVTNNEVISSSNRHAGTHLCDSIDTSANDIYTCIRKGLEKHADVGEDSDRSGELESTEAGVK